MNTITRRDFIKSATYISVAGTLGLHSIAESETKSEDKTKVVLIRDESAFDSNGKLNEKVIYEMLDSAITEFIGEKDAVSSWKLILKPNDIVGVKSNVWYYLPTPTCVENYIKKRIMDIGVDEKNISIDDRGVLENETFLKATALINVRPLRAHNWSGVGGCIKNYIMFSPNPPNYHDDSCANLGALWDLPIVKGKTRLNILLMLKPQFHCTGPHHYNPKYTWNYNGILVSTDPVALDAIGLRIMEAKRLEYFKTDEPIKPTPKHIIIADTKYKLGTSNLEKIKLIKLGWMKDVLI